MKKILIIASLVLLASCGAQNTENNADIVATQTGTAMEETKKLSPENQQILDDFMKEYEEKLRSTGEFSEEIIKQATDQIRAEKTAELLAL